MLLRLTLSASCDKSKICSTLGNSVHIGKLYYPGADKGICNLSPGMHKADGSRSGERREAAKIQELIENCVIPGLNSNSTGSD